MCREKNYPSTIYDREYITFESITRFFPSVDRFPVFSRIFSSFFRRLSLTYRRPVRSLIRPSYFHKLRDTLFLSNLRSSRISQPGRFPPVIVFLPTVQSRWPNLISNLVRRVYEASRPN